MNLSSDRQTVHPSRVVCNRSEHLAEMWPQTVIRTIYMQINSCGVAGAQNVLFEVREQAVCAMWRMVWGNSPGQKFMVPQPEQGRFNCGSTSSTCQNSVSVLVRTPMRCKKRARDGQGRDQSRECIVGQLTEAVRNSCAQPQLMISTVSMRCVLAGVWRVHRRCSFCRPLSTS